MSTDPILYSFRRCPYAIRARLALTVGTKRCELREVKLSAKPDEMLAASPKGTVPVLVLPDGDVLDESLDIMQWALGSNDPEGWLRRSDAKLIARNDTSFKHALDRYKYPDRYDEDPTPHRVDGVAFLHELEARLARAGQLCGQDRGFADAAIMPFVRQFAAVDSEWFAAQPLSHLQAWLAGHLASPLFESVMVRMKPWQPGDEPVVFPTFLACNEA